MKKAILLALAIASLLSAPRAQAQEGMAEQLARQMTEQMTAQYSLTKKQAKKVHALNTDFAEKVIAMSHSLSGSAPGRGGRDMPPGSVMRGHRMGGMPHVPGTRPDGDSVTAHSRARIQARREAIRHHADSLRATRDTSEVAKQRREARRMARQQRLAAHEAEARKIRDDYDAALAKILSPEQLAKYKAAGGK